MFLGHYGIALAAKRAAPRTSLGALTFAAQFLDELWPILLLVGVEQVRIVPGLMAMSPLDFTYYPFSHSLLMAIVYGIVIGVIYFLFRRYNRGAWVMGLLVVSHWFLDVPMHQADLPLWPSASSPKIGLGLWEFAAPTRVIELTIFAVGISLYFRATRPRDRVGTWSLWVYVAALVIIFFASGGAPPPSVRALAWTTLAIWLFVPWAWWIDKHRYYVGRVHVPITPLTPPS